jgi:hypothetical protein
MRKKAVENYETIEVGDLVGFVPVLCEYAGFEGKTGIVISKDGGLLSDIRLCALKAVKIFRTDGKLCRLLETDIYVISKCNADNHHTISV